MIDDWRKLHSAAAKSRPISQLLFKEKAKSRSNMRQKRKQVYKGKKKSTERKSTGGTVVVIQL